MTNAFSYLTISNHTKYKTSPCGDRKSSPPNIKITGFYHLWSPQCNTYNAPPPARTHTHTLNQIFSLPNWYKHSITKAFILIHLCLIGGICNQIDHSKHKQCMANSDTLIKTFCFCGVFTSTLLGKLFKWNIQLCRDGNRLWHICWPTQRRPWSVCHYVIFCLTQ